MLILFKNLDIKTKIKKETFALHDMIKFVHFICGLSSTEQSIDVTRRSRVKTRFVKHKEPQIKVYTYLKEGLKSC